jgi:hypothetical protein
MTTPPPPKYAPTVGLHTTWWEYTSAHVWTPERIASAETGQERLVEAMDQLGRTITETPDERHRRQRQEDDDAHARAGEHPHARIRRHRREDAGRRRRAQVAAALPWRLHHAERAKRFRRWLTLTALSASVGYSVGLVQWVDSLPYWPGVGVLAAAIALDMRIRGVAALPISQVRGLRRVSVLVLVRIPVSSALAAVCQLAPLLAATGHLIHNH